ncbi:YlxR family protein, partial [Deinococcus sp. MIMF12]|nr:YlxR family protein [Deinococcus rhizophilus]
GHRGRSGRGAYLCAASPECWAEKRLRRTFRGDAPAVSAALHAAPPGPFSQDQSQDQPQDQP